MTLWGWLLFCVFPLAVMVAVAFIHAWVHWYRIAAQEQERALRLRRRLYNAYIDAEEWRQVAEELGEAIAEREVRDAC